MPNHAERAGISPCRAYALRDHEHVLTVPDSGALTKQDPTKCDAALLDAACEKKRGSAHSFLCKIGV